MKIFLKKAGSLLLLLMLLLSLGFCELTGDDEEEGEESSIDPTTLLFLFAATSAANSGVSPQVRFVNNSGGTENYSLWNFTSTSVCNSTLGYTFTANPVSTGTTTEYESVPAGTYDISYNSPNNTNCVISTFGFRFYSNSTYTCTSGASSITCASP